MTTEKYGNNDLAVVLQRFPSGRENDNVGTDNPAIHIYGRRFYKDQTPVEYLAEFLLVFASPKQENGEGSYQFANVPCYWPEDRLALKLFSFFPSSKLETRHPVHRQSRRAAYGIRRH